MINTLITRIQLMIGRCVLKAVDDSKGLQALQVEALKGEILDQIERVQNYGFTSVPLPGAEGFVAFINGDREHGIVLAVDDRRYRLKNQAKGEVAIYTDEGDKIHLKRGNTIEVSTTTLQVNADDMNVAGNITATGEVSDGVGTMSAMRLIYNGHGHPALNTPPTQQMPT